eukprot:TRINITY_DN8523_c0_g1_i1.p1 TRINITY_DN8523_c0_g1~~TRINITY_DN8523_c0_g1_i1.p1  ORF type:complete len:373 (+),score=27.04 TRINITY_DN8523_c0_g1_i1:1-1119(+)
MVNRVIAFGLLVVAGLAYSNVGQSFYFTEAGLRCSYEVNAMYHKIEKQLVLISQALDSLACPTASVRHVSLIFENSDKDPFELNKHCIRDDPNFGESVLPDNHEVYLCSFRVLVHETYSSFPFFVELTRFNDDFHVKVSPVFVIGNRDTQKEEETDQLWRSVDLRIHEATSERRSGIHRNVPLAISYDAWPQGEKPFKDLQLTRIAVSGNGKLSVFKPVREYFPFSGPNNQSNLSITFDDIDPRNNFPGEDLVFITLFFTSNQGVLPLTGIYTIRPGPAIIHNENPTGFNPRNDNQSDIPNIDEHVSFICPLLRWSVGIILLVFLALGVKLLISRRENTSEVSGLSGVVYVNMTTLPQPFAQPTNQATSLNH